MTLPAVSSFRRTRFASYVLLVTLCLSAGAANAVSSAFHGLITDIGNTISGMSLDRPRECAAHALNEVKTAFRFGRLAGGGDWTDEDESVSLSGSCAQSAIDVFWFKKTSKIYVRARIACDCTGRSNNDLERGSVRFWVPVRTGTVRGETVYDIGPIAEFTVEGKCCNTGNGDPQVQVFDGQGKRKQLTGITPAPTSPPPISTGGTRPATGSTPVKPAPMTAPPPRPAPKPQSAPPPEPQWSMDNPCPPCEPEKEIVDYFRQRIADLEAKRAARQAELDANRARQGELERDIRRLEEQLKNQQGVGGESTDPSTGRTVKSYDQGDGTVRVETFDRNGNRIDEYSYRRNSTRNAQNAKTAKEAELAKLKQEAERHQTQLDAMDRALAKAKADLQTALKNLADCIEIKCHAKVDRDALGIAGVPTTPAGQSTGQTACGGANVATPIDIGAVSDFKGIGKAAAKAAGGLASKALGGLFGGFSVGGGGGGMNIPENTQTGPKTVKDALKKAAHQSFTDAASGIRLSLAGQYIDDKLLISSTIDDAPGQNTFHTAFLQNADCQSMFPDKYLPYKLYTKWTLDVHWTHDHYVNGQHVKHEEGGWSEGGLFDRGGGMLALGNKPELGGILPVWQRFGYEGPFDGVRSLGTEFRITPQDLQRSPTALGMHVTYQDGDRYRTVGFPLQVNYNDDDKVSFDYIDADETPMQVDLKYKFDGGMTRIDPPTLDLDDNPYVIQPPPVNLHELLNSGGMTSLDPPTTSPGSATHTISNDPLVERGSTDVANTVSREEIEKLPQRDIKDIINLAPGVHTDPTAPAVNIRGIPNTDKPGAPVSVDGVVIRSPDDTLMHSGTDSRILDAGREAFDTVKQSGGTLAMSHNAAARAAARQAGALDLGPAETGVAAGRTLISLDASKPVSLQTAASETLRAGGDIEQAVTATVDLGRNLNAGQSEIGQSVGRGVQQQTGDWRRTAHAVGQALGKGDATVDVGGKTLTAPIAAADIAGRVLREAGVDPRSVGLAAGEAYQAAGGTEITEAADAAERQTRATYEERAKANGSPVDTQALEADIEAVRGAQIGNFF